jgi:outer membrane protein assembly factor BamE (lipoprotein component of BamABCDE complex)
MTLIRFVKKRTVPINILGAGQMKKKNNELIRTSLVLLILTSCISACVQTPTTPVTTRNSELTHGNVQMNLEVGKTSQTEVLEVFGAPNITSIDGTGQEVWTYQRHATVSQSSSSSSYWTIILVGGKSSASGFEQTQRTITLIIKFNSNKVVSDFKSRSSNF